MKDILLAFVHVFAMMAPWLVFGFLMAGIIAVWIPRSWVNRMMGGSSGFRGILRAVAIGVPLPICSCGVLPIAAGLRKHGAGKARLPRSSSPRRRRASIQSSLPMLCSDPSSRWRVQSPPRLLAS